MELALTPEQPPEIERAVAAALEAALDVTSSAPDPWWRAGNQESLGT